MILKPRTKPLTLKKYEKLLERTPRESLHYERIRIKTSQLYKGYIGEKKFDYHLARFPANYIILNSVTLRDDNGRFQIDSMIITQKAIYIIEIKHYNGTITFNTILNQCVHNDIGRRYPPTQADTQRIRLTSWLHRHHYSNIPIYFYIAIADPATIIKIVGNEKYISDIVAHGEFIPKKLMTFDEELKGANIASQDIGKLINREHTEGNPDIIGRIGIKDSEVIKGVKCPSCQRFGMKRVRKNWECNHCKVRDRTAHFAALNDFFQLYKPEITNTECQKWLGLESRHVAKRLLSKFGLTFNKETGIWRK